MARRATPSHRAFTLIELLVVISIIALLVAILLPALSQARESARTVQCLSQLRNIQIWNLSYAEDFQQFMPSPNAWVTGVYSLRYNEQVTPYVTATEGLWSRTNMSNFYLCPGSDYSYATWMGTNDTYAQSAIQSGWKVTQYLPTGYWGYGPWNTEPEKHHPRRAPIRASAVGYMIEVKGSSAERIGRYGYWGGVRYSHQADSSNVMFADGHAANIAGLLEDANGDAWNWSEPTN